MEKTTTSITPGFDRGQTVKDIFGLQQPYLNKIETAEKNVIAADADLLRATEEQKRNLAKERTAVQQTAAAQEKTANEEYKRQKAAEPIPAFVPTKDSAEDLAKLFSFIGVAGTLVGRGAGKQSAMGAMSAMTGMMEGWQKGRMDLYNQEKTKFDKDFSRVQKIHQDLAKELDTAVRTIATNRDLGLKIAEEAALNAGSDVLLAKIRKGELIGARDMAVRTADAFKESMKQTQAREDKFITAQAQIAAARERAAGGGATGAGWKTYETKDGKIIRYNSRTNQIEGGDISELVGSKPIGASQKTSGGAANDRYAFNITESFAQAATDLLNVSQMPGNTVLGVFAGMTGQTGDTLIKSLQNALARQVTNEDSRLMQQIVAGLDQNMARALGGGYATSTSKGLIQAYKEQVAQVGDSPLAQAMFLSRMKQELEILAKAFKSHPGAREGYVSDMKEYVSELNKSIPFNVSDVIAANRGKKQTVTDKFSYLAQKPVSMRLPEEGEPVRQSRPAPAPAPAPAVKPVSTWTESDESRLRELENKLGTK
jgi:hypothetical protein